MEKVGGKAVALVEPRGEQLTGLVVLREDKRLAAGGADLVQNGEEHFGFAGVLRTDVGGFVEVLLGRIADHAQGGDEL